MHAARLMSEGLDVVLKRGWCVTWLLLAIGLSSWPTGANAQTTLLSEGFEGSFPADNGWSVGDSNGAGSTAYWDDVNSPFGGEGTHSGTWKGYCAGLGFSGSTAVPFYRDSMIAFMNRSVNLAGYSHAKVQFWFKVPSIELNFDFCRVRVDGAQVWVTNLPVASWSQANVSLNPYVGIARTLSFEFTSDATVTNEGWYLDDISVMAANAPVAEFLEQMALTNYTGYVIDSDASNAGPGYNRETLLVSSVVRSENFTTGPTNNSYYLSYRLLNAGTGLPHPIYDSTGVTNTAYTYNLTNNFVMSALESVSRTNLASIKPATRLDPYSQYTVELKLFRGTSFTGLAASDGPRTYYHFTNLVSSDSALNVIAALNSATLVRTAAVQTVAAKKSFTVDANFTLRRYDSFTNAAPVSSNVTVSLNYELRNAATEAVIPTTASSSNFLHAVFSYTPGSINPVTPRELTFADTLQIEPAVQLDSVSNIYKVVVTIAHVDTAGQPAVTGNTQTTASSRLLHFNGKLFFGPIETTFTSIANDPPTVGVTPTFVRSELAVDANSGVISSNSGFTYGSGAALTVLLRPNGNAELTSGSVLVTPPAVPDSATNANVRFERGPITLDTGGAHADVTVTLPTGFGYRFDLASRILLSTFAFANVPLSQMLDPASSLTFGGLFYAVEETKPVWIECNTLTWQINLGNFILSPVGPVFYVRDGELAALETAPGLVEADMRFKRSNEQYFRFLNAVSSAQVIVAADSDGTARMTVNGLINPGEFRTHFPYDAFVKWTSTGAMQISQDQVTPSGSQLNAVEPVTLGYNADCLDINCPPMNGVENLELSVTNGVLHFTLDGGLQAAGTLTGSPDLNWGYIGLLAKFAQHTDPFTNANFHMSGCWLRGDQTGLPDNEGPGVILNTGVQPGNLASTERPGTGGYLDGFADYPGFNFRVGGDGLKRAESVLAAVPSGLYPLTGRSKYYTRWAGVSGIHEAVFGSFPTNATLYGYQVNFSNYGLSYLDSENHESRTEGFIHVGGPSNFDQNFKELMFNCLGALTSAKVPGNETDLFKMLQYWNADFVAQAIKFDRADGAICDPGVGYLVLGVKAFATHVNQPLYGELGFRSNGNLITAEDISSGTVLLDPPFNSRLKGPNNFKLKGPAGEQYNVTLVADIYLNNYEHYAQPPPAGFMNLIVKLDVPFFEDLKGHIHTGARTNDPTGLIYLMGGWGTPNKGFSDAANKHFFNTAGFDEDNVGFPKSGLFPNPVSVADYHNNNASDRYHVRAQRTWLGVVPFDYPLDWSSSTRSFKSHAEVENDLLVLHVKHQCKYLSAENAELSFGAQFGALPQLNLANMVFNAVDEATGAFNAVGDAIGDTTRDAIDLGLAQLNKALCDLSHQLFEQPLNDLMTPVANTLYSTLQTKFNPVTKQWAAGEPALTIQTYFTGLGPQTFLQKFKDLMGSSPAFPGLLKELDQTLLDVTNALQKVRTVLAESPPDSGHRLLVKNLVTELVGELAASFASALVDDKLNELLKDADPTLDQVDAVMAELVTVIGQLRGALQSGGQLNKELNDLFNAPASLALINTFVNQAQTDITGFFNGINISVDNPFQDYSPQEIKDLIRQKLEDRFFGSALSASIQTIVKQRLYDLNAAVREGIDSVFQQVNTTIRDVISETLAEVSNEFTAGLGDLSSVFGAARIDGYAHINGDSLKLLRLDVLAKLNFSSEMEFKAFLQIKELDSEGTPTECLPSSGKATEVTCGATGSGLDWISPDLKASIGAKFTFDTGSGFKLVNLGGSFEITGELDFEGFAIKELGLAMSVGQLENYLAAKLRVEFNKKEFAGGVFFGKTCSLDPLKLADPNVADVVGAPPFTGFYVYGEAWYPINELIGIPTTCFFNVVGGAGVGTFFFAEGPTFGGRIHYGISGEVLCIVEIKGEVDLIGVKKGDDYTFKGKGTLSGELGICPFCVDFSKSVSMTCKVHLQLGGDASVSWDIDL